MSQPPAPMQLFVPGEPSDPPAGLSYPEALTRPGQSPAQPVFGLLLAFSAFALITPLFAQLILRVGHLFRGGEWADYLEAADSYLVVEGPVSGLLALALLTPICMLLVRYVNGIRPRWLFSVQPGPRWRYLLMCLVVAVVILNAVLWVGYAVKGVPEFHGGDAGWLVYLVALSVTSPLQAVAEEVFFRGYLLQGIGTAVGHGAWGTWAGVVGSAAVFAMLHGTQNPALFAHRLSFGLIMGALVVVTGGLEAGIAAHVVNNLGAYAYALFTSSIADLKSTTAITWTDAAFDIAGFAIFAVVAWWLGRRLKVAVTTP